MGDTKTWYDAKINCELYGSHLLQIDSLTENYCILDYAHKQGKTNTWWHSGNDIDSEGVFRQADGELIVWTPPFWGYNEPNGGTGENCLVVCLDSNEYAGKWWDAPCTLNYHYICERS